MAAKDIKKRKRTGEAVKELLKKIERAKQEWESTADSLPELVCLVDDRKRIIRANRTVEAWNLGRIVDIKGGGVHELLHPGCEGSHCYLNSFWNRACEKAIRGQPSKCEAYDEILKRHIIVQVQPLRKGRSNNCTVVVVRDITERKRAEEADNSKRLSEMLINFQEEEKKRVARELHDEIGQVLTAIKLSLGMTAKYHSKLEDSVLKELQEAIKLVDSAMGSIHRISARLRPEILDNFGLGPCIEHEVNFFSKRSRVDIKFVSEGLNSRLKPQKEIALYRVVQEALTNIIKHSKASKAEVNLTRRGNKVLLSIYDNGEGFEVTKLRNSPGLGLLGMQERITFAGGSFKISSRSPRGTLLEIEMPV